jgi:hypothetical protein
MAKNSESASTASQRLPERRMLNLLKTIPPMRIEALRSFFRCDAFDSDKYTRALLEIFLKCLYGKSLETKKYLQSKKPDLEQTLQSREWLYIQLFDRKRYDQAQYKEKLEPAFSACMKGIEQFIAVEQMLKDPVSPDLYLVEHLAATDEKEMFGYNLKKLQKAVGEMPLGRRKYLLTVALEYHKQAYPAYNRQATTVEEFMTLYYAHEKYKKLMDGLLWHEANQHKDLLVRKKGKSKTPNQDERCILTDLIDEVDKMRSLPGPDEQLYDNLFGQYQAMINQIDTLEKGELLQRFKNYCIIHSNAGHKGMQERLHRTGQEKNGSSDSVKSNNDFLNEITSLGLNGSLKEMKLSIEAHNDLPYIDDAAKSFAQAYYEFCSKDYEKSLYYLHLISENNPTYSIRYHQLHLRAAFCLARQRMDFSDMKNETDTRAHFFNDTENISEDYKKTGRRLVKFVRWFVQVSKQKKLDKNMTNRDFLLKEMEDEKEKPPMAPEWVLSMIDELAPEQ